MIKEFLFGYMNVFKGISSYPYGTYSYSIAWTIWSLITFLLYVNAIRWLYDECPQNYSILAWLIIVVLSILFPLAFACLIIMTICEKWEYIIKER